MAVAGRRMLVLVLASTLLCGGAFDGGAAPIARDEERAAEASCCCASTAAAARERCCCCCAPRLADDEDAPPPAHQARCLCGRGGLPPMAPGQTAPELRVRSEAPAVAACPVTGDSRAGRGGLFHLTWLQERAGVLPPVRVLYCVWQT